tara:strand:- start:104 stop:580 length:477 start_codon:yes stop_codon:yes gene_type:complete
MSFKPEDIKPNSAKAVWHVAYMCAASDGSISNEEHIGMVNTYKITSALTSVVAKAAGLDPDAAQKEAFDRQEEFLEMWVKGGITSIDDDFVKYSLSLITDSVWRDFAVAVALFSCSMDGLDDNEDSLIGMIMEEWDVDTEEVQIWLEKILKVAKTGSL